MPERPATAPRMSSAAARSAARRAWRLCSSRSQNIRYLTGFTGSDRGAPRGRGQNRPLLWTAATTQAAEQAPGPAWYLYRDQASGSPRPFPQGLNRSVSSLPSRRWSCAELPAPEVEKVCAGSLFRGARRHSCRQGCRRNQADPQGDPHRRRCPEVNPGAHPARGERARHCHRARICHAQEHGRRSPPLTRSLHQEPTALFPTARPGSRKIRRGLRGHRLRGRLARVPLGRDLHLCRRRGGKAA